MTSAARTSDARGSRQGGFTLLEIVMVLAIVAIVIGGAVSMLVFHSSERELKRVSGDIEVMAKRARTIALLQQKPYAIVFTPGKVRLMPLAETMGTEQQVSRTRDASRSRSDSRSDSSTSEETPSSSAALAPVYDELALEPDFDVNIRHWASDKWEKMDERRAQVWRFDPEGLCEPITVRLTYKNSWVEDEFHPLTASISDSSTEFK